MQVRSGQQSLELGKSRFKAGRVIASRLGQVRAPAAFAAYPRPLIEAALYGGLTALIFTLWPLARTREIRAAALYRDAAGRRRWNCA